MHASQSPKTPSARDHKYSFFHLQGKPKFKRENLQHILDTKRKEIRNSQAHKGKRERDLTSHLL